jgi:ribosomal protein L37AE/L43A
VTTQPTSLHAVPDLPRCPHCDSPRVTSGFTLDWIDVPAGTWVCSDCDMAFIPKAWKK